MLVIKNIEKIIGVKLRNVQVKQVQMINKEHPQRTYNILYTHDDYPNSEFLVMIDRESQEWSNNGDCREYPLQLHELHSPTLNPLESFNIWESNMKTHDAFIGFIENLTDYSFKK